ncbi:hypothetical protein WJX75_008153 [Coccomyxa subellipsoidea]|uniref:Uncharacterized protein n=1 Tax=Coccomyxa subellipsoidea TaxID=248742 RepID=A0ABR2YAB4_9CHLO
MDRTALGCSVRVGCPVRFAFRRQPGTEVIVEIQYYDRQHVNHGTEAQDGPGLGITAARRFGQSKPPKDYFLNSMDVANIRRVLDKREWMFSDNPQESVHMFKNAQICWKISSRLSLTRCCQCWCAAG